MNDVARPAGAEERRQHPRSVVRLPVVVRPEAGGASPVSLVAIDVSPGGMLVSPALPGSAGDRVIVTARHFGEQLEARIVGQRQQGTALRFLDSGLGELITVWLVEQSIRLKGG